MFPKKIFTFHSWEYISWKCYTLNEIWITWFLKESAKPDFQILNIFLEKQILGFIFVVLIQNLLYKSTTVIP